MTHWSKPSQFWQLSILLPTQTVVFVYANRYTNVSCKCYVQNLVVELDILISCAVMLRDQLRCDVTRSVALWCYENSCAVMLQEQLHCDVTRSVALWCYENSCAVMLRDQLRCDVTRSVALWCYEISCAVMLWDQLRCDFTRSVALWCYEISCAVMLREQFLIKIVFLKWEYKMLRT